MLNPIGETITGGRACAADVAAVRMLLLDCDPVGEGTTDDARALAEALAAWLVERGGQPAVVFSGRGWQLWLPHESVPVGDEVRALRRRLVRGLAARWSTPQAKVDATPDEARLARLPGTLNLKTGRRAELVQRPGAPIALAALEALADELAPPAPPAAPAPPRPTPSQGELGREDWDYLQASSALEALSPDCDHADWLAIGMSLHATGYSWAFTAWDSWSRGGRRADGSGRPVYPGSEALRRRWDSFGAGGGVGPGTLYALAAARGWSWPRAVERFKSDGTIPHRQRPPATTATSSPTTEPAPPPAPPAPAGDLPPYPLWVWPRRWRDVIEAQAAVGLTDPAIPAAYATAALGSLLGTRWTFALGPVECRPIAWCVVVAPSGISGKSLAVSALRGSMSVLSGERYREWSDRHSAWEGLDKKARDMQEEPAYAALVAEDTTLEAMVRILDASGGVDGLLNDRDELAGWLGGMDAYRGGRGGDRAAWLTLRSGGPYHQVRVSRAPVYLPRTHVCLFGGVQPERLSAFDLRDGDGLFSRFMWSVCPPRTEYGFGPAFVLGGQTLRLLRAAQLAALPSLVIEAGAVDWLARYRRQTDGRANGLYHADRLSLASTVVSRASLYATTALSVMLGADVSEAEIDGATSGPVTIGRDLCERAEALARYYVAHGLRAVSSVLRPLAADDAEAKGHDRVAVSLAVLEGLVQPGQALELSTGDWAERLGLPSAVLAGRALGTLERVAPHGWSVGRRRSGGARLWAVARLPR